jgi:hypothetical protein
MSQIPQKWRGKLEGKMCVCVLQGVFLWDVKSRSPSPMAKCFVPYILDWPKKLPFVPRNQFLLAENNFLGQDMHFLAHQIQNGITHINPGGIWYVLGTGVGVNISIASPFGNKTTCGFAGANLEVNLPNTICHAKVWVLFGGAGA